MASSMALLARIHQWSRQQSCQPGSVNGTSQATLARNYSWYCHGPLEPGIDDGVIESLAGQERTLV